MSLKKTALLNRLFLIICISIIFMTGCAARNDGYPNEMGAGPGTDQNNQLNGQNDQLNGINSPDGVAPQGMNGQNQRAGYVGTNPNANNSGTQLSQNNGDDRQKAENIKNQLKNSKGAEQCGVIVNGDTAIVGLLTKGMTNSNNTDAGTIEKRVKEIDPSITKVLVTEAPDIVNEINRMSTDTNNNTPGNELKDSFNKLMQKINKVS